MAHQWLIGDYVIIDDLRSAVINGIFGDDFYCIDFRTQKQLDGSFNEDQLKKVDFHTAYENSREPAKG